MRKWSFILLAWWFMWMGDNKIIGPFKSEKECNRIRQEVKDSRRILFYKTHSLTSCWEGRLVFE